MAASFSSWEVRGLMRKHGLWTAQAECSQNFQSKQPGRVRASIRHRKASSPELSQHSLSEDEDGFPNKPVPERFQVPQLSAHTPSIHPHPRKMEEGPETRFLRHSLLLQFCHFDYTSSWKMSMTSQCMSITICSSSIRETLISICFWPIVGNLLNPLF